jgi:hypothetical protein
MPTKPGILRQQGISEEGLQRLQQQLAAGTRVSKPVLVQWIRRYGEPARDIIRAHNQYAPGFDHIV